MKSTKKTKKFKLFKNRDNFAAFVFTVSALAVLVIVPMVAKTTVSNSTVASLSSNAKTVVNVSAEEWIIPSLEAFSADYRSINVNWQKAGNYNNYIIEQSSTANFANKTSKNVTGLTALITGLSAETTYYFRVQAVGAPGTPTGSWSKTAVAKTSPQAPTTQSLLFPTTDPHGSNLDSKGNLLISDYAEGVVKKVTPNGVVQEIGNRTPGSGMRQVSVVDDNNRVVVMSYKDTVTPLSGIYKLNSKGEYSQVVNLLSPYGIAYDKKRNKVFVSHSRFLSECDYVTWDCKVVAENDAGGIGYLSMTPSGNSIVMAGSNKHILSVYDIDDKKRTVLVNSPNMDVRGAVALNDYDYLAASWKTGDVWRIQVNPQTGEVSTQTVITGGTTPRSMAYDAEKNILYLGMSKPISGVYKYENLIR